MNFTGSDSNACLRALFPAQLFGLASVAGPSGEHALFAEEAAIVAGAVSKRRAEFAAGRHCARAALGQLGRAGAPLLRLPDGAPDWPAGTVGSISHTEGCVVGVAALDTLVCAVGVDVEQQGDTVPPGVLALVCNDAERRWLAALPSDEAAGAVRALFSVKEAVVKCTSGLLGRRPVPSDISIELDLACGVFRAMVGSAIDRNSRFSPLSGRVAANGHHVFAAVWRLRQAHRTTFSAKACQS